MKLIVIRGISGSGKTTKAKAIKKEMSEKTGHFEADMFFVNNDGEYVFDGKKIGAAHKWCQTYVESYLIQHTDVIVSNTFTQKWEVQPYIDLAKKYDAELVIYRMTKEYANTHGVPADKVAQMKARFEDIEGEILAE